MFFARIKRCCSVSRVARIFCQYAAGSFRRSRFVPKFVWMKLILISLNGVRLSSAIPLDRVATTRGGYRRSVLAREEHVREREIERERKRPALSATRRIVRSSRVTGTCLCTNCLQLSFTSRHTTCVCRGDISARSISVCEKMRWTRTDDEPGNFSSQRFPREDIYRRHGTMWTRREPAWSLDSKSRQTLFSRPDVGEIGHWYMCICVCQYNSYHIKIIACANRF